MMSLVGLLKRLPVDLGQGHFRHTTKAKVTAFELAGAGKERKALDVGCGDGFWSNKLKKRGWSVTSIDKEDDRYSSMVQVDIEGKLPFESNSFDLIWASEVIEHVRDINEAIEEFRRVLKPGGTMIITTPNSFFWLFRVATLFGTDPSQIQNKDHKHFFKYSNIVKLFPRAKILGFFPYNLVKVTISRGVGILSPTFIVIDTAESPNEI